MKRFISKRERAKKKRRNQIAVGIVLTFLMFLSVLGFAFQFGVGVPNEGNGQTGGQENVVYNGVEFVFNSGFWIAEGFAFRYNPGEVQDIQPSGEELKDVLSYQGKPLYLYSENQEARSEIRVNLGVIASNVESGCPEGEFECPEEIPTISCDGDNFIIIKEGVNNAITQEGSCVFIEGPSEDLTKISDQFLFKILGIR
ncbi:MAG: hypothetical protein WDZ62_01860 [Candidatus Pacearchaeota archaeon]